MAERTIPAAHAETKLLMGARQWSHGKGTPEGGQPMSTRNGGPAREFRKGLKEFRGARRGCQLCSSWVLHREEGHMVNITSVSPGPGAQGRCRAGGRFKFSFRF